MSEPILDDARFTNYCGHEVLPQWDYCPACQALVVSPAKNLQDAFEQIVDLEIETKDVKNAIKALRERINKLDPDIHIHRENLEPKFLHPCSFCGGTGKGVNEGSPFLSLCNTCGGTGTQFRS